jgi:hypothetical protein
LVIEKGAEVSVEDQQQLTPLNLAKMNGHLATVKLLEAAAQQASHADSLASRRGNDHSTHGR